MARVVAWHRLGGPPRRRRRRAACIGAVIFPMAHPENAPFVLALVVVYLTAFVVENLRPEGKK